jgi:glycerophosphoryl diester phosphodiesterase
MLQRLGSIALAAAFALAARAAPVKPATRKVVIAHRGASGYLPEHTLPAVAMAHALGADFVEPDVVLTKDDVPVVLHDVHLDATTDVATVFPTRKRGDGRWYAVDFTLAEIRTLAVRERRDVRTNKAVFPNRFPENTAVLRVPTLEEEILLVQGLNQSTGRSVGLYPELKAPAFHAREGKDLARVVLPILANRGYSDKDANLYLQCFDPQELKRIRTELGSKLKLVQLIGASSWKENDADFDAMQTDAGLKAIATYADAIGPWIPQILDVKTRKPTGLVARAHKAGLAVHPYTLRVEDLPAGVTFDQALDAILFKAGADGLFTDFADKAVRYLATQRGVRAGKGE